MIQQVAFDVPKEIALGLASGEYVQCGGVVRDAAGHIVKHLEPADVSNDANKAMQVAAQAIQLAKENKKATVGVLAIAGVAAAGGAVYAGVTHLQHKKEERARKTALDDFNAAGRFGGGFLDAGFLFRLNLVFSTEDRGHRITFGNTPYRPSAAARKAAPSKSRASSSRTL